MPRKKLDKEHSRWAGEDFQQPIVGAVLSRIYLLHLWRRTHGSFSGCIFVVDPDQQLVITQVRKRSGPRSAEWSAGFFQTIAAAIAAKQDQQEGTGAEIPHNQPLPALMTEDVVIVVWQGSTDDAG